MIDKSELMKSINTILSIIESCLSNFEQYMNAIMNISKFCIATNVYPDNKYKKLLLGA